MFALIIWRGLLCPLRITQRAGEPFHPRIYKLAFRACSPTRATSRSCLVFYVRSHLLTLLGSSIAFIDELITKPVSEPINASKRKMSSLGMSCRVHCCKVSETH